eukprot:Selendium_serpulae@DN5929_c0_g1_i2.p1
MDTVCHPVYEHRSKFDDAEDLLRLSSCGSAVDLTRRPSSMLSSAFLSDSDTPRSLLEGSRMSPLTIPSSVGERECPRASVSVAARFALLSFDLPGALVKSGVPPITRQGTPSTRASTTRNFNGVEVFSCDDGMSEVKLDFEDYTQIDDASSAWAQPFSNAPSTRENAQPSSHNVSSTRTKALDKGNGNGPFSKLTEENIRLLECSSQQESSPCSSSSSYFLSDDSSTTSLGTTYGILDKIKALQFCDMTDEADNSTQVSTGVNSSRFRVSRGAGDRVFGSKELPFTRLSSHTTMAASSYASTVLSAQQTARSADAQNCDDLGETEDDEYEDGQAISDHDIPADESAGWVCVCNNKRLHGGAQDNDSDVCWLRLAPFDR